MLFLILSSAQQEDKVHRDLFREFFEHDYFQILNCIFFHAFAFMLSLKQQTNEKNIDQKMSFHCFWKALWASRELFHF